MKDDFRVVFTRGGEGEVNVAVLKAKSREVGVKAGQDEQLMKGELHRISLWVIGALAVLGGLYYVFVRRHMKGASR